MKVEMISWITMAMGVFLAVVGIVIWAGKKIDLVHGEDSYKVAEEHRAVYARILGIGVLMLALAVVAYGVLSCFPAVPTYVQWIAVGVFGGVGMLILILGHKKYFPDGF